METTPRSGAVPSLWLCLRPSPASGTLTSHALLAQTSLERQSLLGCQHPQRIYAVFTLIFGGANPFIAATAIQLTYKLYYNESYDIFF